MSSFKIFISSNNRDYGTNSNYTVSFPNMQIQNQEVKLGIEQFIMPNLTFPIRAGKNKLIINEGGGDLTVTIPDGSYTSTLFCTALKDALDLAGALTYSCTISATTNYLTISATGAFTLKISSASTSSVMWQILGFSNSYSTSAASHTGIYPVRTSGDDYLFIEITNLSNNNLNSAYPTYSILDAVPINCNFGDVVFYKGSESNYTLSLDDELNQVSIRLRDQYGNDYPIPVNSYFFMTLRAESSSFPEV